MTILGKLICAVTRKHKRGKRVTDPQCTTAGFIIYECPRCSARWERKVRNVPPV